VARYPEGAIELEPGKIRPMKDVHSHIHDALQMITSRIFEIASRRIGGRVPNQSYSWQNKKTNGLFHGRKFE
jgi:hypothetical protein